MQQPYYKKTMKTICSIHLAYTHFLPKLFTAFEQSIKAKEITHPNILTYIYFLIYLVYALFPSEKCANYCFVLSTTIYTPLHLLQSPFINCQNPITEGAKPCQQLLIPLYNRCKALSTTVDTPLQEVQSPVNNCWNPFAAGKV